MKFSPQRYSRIRVAPAKIAPRKKDGYVKVIQNNTAPSFILIAERREKFMRSAETSRRWDKQNASFEQATGKSRAF